MDSPVDTITFIGLPIFVGIAVILFILVLTPFAERIRLLDVPDHRKRHGVPVPLVGGLAIYLVLLSSALILEPPLSLCWLIFSTTLLVLTGLLDDAVGLGVRTRFAAEVLASGLMLMGSGFWIQSVGINLWGLNSLPTWLGVGLTLFAVVGLTNGFNMVDGIDGLASGHMMVGLISLAIALIWVFGAHPRLLWLAILISAVFAFWLVNLSLIPVKKVFLGDAGSLMLGFVMAWTLIFYTQHPVSLLNPVIALWCVTIPVYDTLVVIARRLKNRRSPFSPDRNHLHHILIDSGMSSRRVLGLILLMSAVVNTLGIWLVFAVSSEVSLMVYLVLFGTFTYGMLHPQIERRLAIYLRLVERGRVT